MPKTDAETTATQSEDMGKNGGPKPRNQQELRQRSEESKEAALGRAFGDVVDDDDLLSTLAAADAGSDEEGEEIGSNADESSNGAGEDPRISALQAKIDQLESKLEERVEAERARQEDPDEEEPFEVEIPQGWDEIAPAFKQLGNRSDERTRALAQQVEQAVTNQFQIQAKLDLMQFRSDHPDFTKYADRIADVAKNEEIDLYDYKSLKVVYDLVKGREAIAQLSATEKKQAVATEMSKKAGAVPRFRSTQQQTRDEEVAPGKNLLSFNEAWEKGLARVRKNQRR